MRNRIGYWAFLIKVKVFRPKKKKKNEDFIY
jgi:hypothetical protein